MTTSSNKTSGKGPLGGAVSAVASGMGDRMTKQDACLYLGGIHARTLERIPSLPKLRWQGRVWYSRSALDDFLAKRERGLA